MGDILGSAERICCRILGAAGGASGSGAGSELILSLDVAVSFSVQNVAAWIMNGAANGLECSDVLLGSSWRLAFIFSCSFLNLTFSCLNLIVLFTFLHLCSASFARCKSRSSFRGIMFSNCRVSRDKTQFVSSVVETLITICVKGDEPPTLFICLHLGILIQTRVTPLVIMGLPLQITASLGSVASTTLHPNCKDK